jgi:hypothetical protein
VPALVTTRTLAEVSRRPPYWASKTWRPGEPACLAAAATATALMSGSSSPGFGVQSGLGVGVVADGAVDGAVVGAVVGAVGCVADGGVLLGVVVPDVAAPDGVVAALVGDWLELEQDAAPEAAARSVPISSPLRLTACMLSLYAICAVAHA